MIEKLDPIKHTENLYDKNGFITNVACGGVVISKVNQLVDAVNGILDYAPLEMAQKAEPDGDDAIQEVIHADPYAKQKKWIGKLCKFWDDDAFVTSNDWAFGMLTSIDKGMQYQYCCNENCNFKHCEPVKPDEDIIYKGE